MTGRRQPRSINAHLAALAVELDRLVTVVPTVVATAFVSCRQRRSKAATSTVETQRMAEKEQAVAHSPPVAPAECRLVCDDPRSVVQVVVQLGVQDTGLQGPATVHHAGGCAERGLRRGLALLRRGAVDALQPGRLLVPDLRRNPPPACLSAHGKAMAGGTGATRVSPHSPRGQQGLENNAGCRDNASVREHTSQVATYRPVSRLGTDATFGALTSTSGRLVSDWMFPLLSSVTSQRSSGVPQPAWQAPSPSCTPCGLLQPSHPPHML